MPPLRGTGRQSLRRRPSVAASGSRWSCTRCQAIGVGYAAGLVAPSEWGRRGRCVCGFALACTATALAACGAAREDRSERSPLPRTYPIEMQSLAGCAIERLGKKYGKIQKTDFPDRYMVRLRRETDSVTLWDLDLIAVDQESARVTIVIPPKVENVQPDQIFADLDTFPVPPTGAARTPR